MSGLPRRRRGRKRQARARVTSADQAVQNAAADLLASGEVTGKMLRDRAAPPAAGLKAKRLLLVGGGKAKNFSSFELRKLAGAAVRFLKPKTIRSLPSSLPELGRSEQLADAVKAAVEGAFVGNFDPDTYKSDRKDQLIEELTLVVVRRRGSTARSECALARSKAASSASRRTSPATWSTSPATA